MRKFLDVMRICMWIISTVITSTQGKLEITSLHGGYRNDLTTCPGLIVNFNTDGFSNSSFELLLNPDYDAKTTDCHTTKTTGVCYADIKSIFEDEHYIQIVETLSNKTKIRSDWWNLTMTIDRLYGPIVNLTATLLKDSKVQLSWIQNWKKTCYTKSDMSARYQTCIAGTCTPSGQFELYKVGGGVTCTALNNRSDRCVKDTKLTELSPFTQYRFQLQYKTYYWSGWSNNATLVTTGYAPTIPPTLNCHLDQEEFAVLKWEVSRNDMFLGSINKYKIFVYQRDILVDRVDESGQYKDYLKYNRQLKMATVFYVQSCTEKNCSAFSHACSLEPKSPANSVGNNGLMYGVYSTLGTVAIVSIIVFILLWYRRKRKRTFGVENSVDDLVDPRQFQDDADAPVAPYATFYQGVQRIQQE